MRREKIFWVLFALCGIRNTGRSCLIWIWIIQIPGQFQVLYMYANHMLISLSCVNLHVKFPIHLHQKIFAWYILFFFGLSGRHMRGRGCELSGYHCRDTSPVDVTLCASMTTLRERPWRFQSSCLYNTAKKHLPLLYSKCGNNSPFPLTATLETK